MALVGLLLIFFVTTAIAQNPSNSSTTASSPTSSVVPSSLPLQFRKFDSKVFHVYPRDVENNTAQYMRSDSSLNRLLALSSTPNLQTNEDIDAELRKTLSIDKLANQLGVTVTEPNLLGNFNNLNVETVSRPVPVQQNPLLFNAFQTQSVNDYLNPNALLSQVVKEYETTSPVQNLGSDTLQSLLNGPQQVTLTKVLQTPPVTLSNTDNDQLLNSLQTLLNQNSQVPNNQVFQLPNQQETLLTDVGNGQLQNSLQTLFNQSPKDSVLRELFQTPNLHQSLLTDTSNNQYSNLLQSLLGQPTELSNQPGLSGLLQLLNPLNTGINAGQNLDSLQALLGQQLDQPNQQLPNLLQTNQLDLLQTNPYNPLATLLPSDAGNLVTQIVFKNHVPNLHIQNCKTVFGALLQKAFVQYLKLASLPLCQENGANPLPLSPLPFEIIIVPSKQLQPQQNSVLTKLLWVLLSRLQNQHPTVPNNPNSMLPFLLQLILKLKVPVVSPGPGPLPNVVPTPVPKPDLSPYLLLLLKLLKNPSQNPSQAYLVKVIIEILKKKSPNNEVVIPDHWNPFDVSPTPGFLPDLPIPDFPELPELSNPRVKYVILVFRKYLPNQQFTVPDILYLVKLVNTLPKTFNELLQNPQLLRQVILQLTNRSLNPKLILAVIYNHLIQLSNQNFPDYPDFVNPGSNDKVVELHYQVKRQPPFVYQPYYYLSYKLPYPTFVNRLYKLLLAKPYLKQNRAQLLKELLVLAVTNPYGGVSSDFNGVSKEYLVQLILKQGAVPLDVKVVSESDNVLSEQLKVVNTPGSDSGLLTLGGDSTLSQLLGGTELSQLVGGTDLSQLVGGTDLSQLVGGTDLSQLVGGTDLSQLVGGTDLSQLVGGTDLSQLVGGTDLSQLLGGTDLSRLVGGTDLSQLVGGTDLSQLLGGTDLSRLVGGTDLSQLVGGTDAVVNDRSKSSLWSYFFKQLMGAPVTQTVGPLVNPVLQLLGKSNVNLRAGDNVPTKQEVVIR